MLVQDQDNPRQGKYQGTSNNSSTNKKEHKKNHQTNGCITLEQQGKLLTMKH
jgi:hypothetical protein